MNKDSVAGTLGTALLLSLACSVLVSGAAVMLRPVQEANRARDKKKNILQAAGLLTHDSAIDATFASRIRPRVIDLQRGETDSETDPATYDALKVAADPAQAVQLSPEVDIAGIRHIAPKAVVYEVLEGEKARSVVLPIHGKGLWSTLYGFLSVAMDGTTVRGIVFYAHQETPGLGGEIDNPRWRALWIGKKLVNPDGITQIEVVKGMVSGDRPGGEYQVDGLSGATITGRGVGALVRFWIGEHGFGAYLARLRQAEQGVGS